MKTVQELLIAICDDLQEYLNDTPITEIHIDVTNRLLELLKDFKVLYVDTDSVKVESPEGEDWMKSMLEDFDISEILKTMNQPIDYNTRKPFSPTMEGIYCLAGTHSKYQCIGIDYVHHIYTMRNIETGWVCDVRDIGVYNNYSIDWAYSTNGYFEKE